jgi:hypothetical protein
VDVIVFAQQLEQLPLCEPVAGVDVWWLSTEGAAEGPQHGDGSIQVAAFAPQPTQLPLGVPFVGCDAASQLVQVASFAQH